MMGGIWGLLCAVYVDSVNEYVVTCVRMEIYGFFPDFISFLRILVIITETDIAGYLHSSLELLSLRSCSASLKNYNRL